MREILSFSLLFLYSAYLLSAIKIRIKNIRTKYLFLFIIGFALFGIIYLVNIYYFNNFQSLSYGSDSSGYEKLLILTRTKGLSFPELNFVIFNQLKGFHLFLLAPIYYIFGSNVIASVFVYLISFFTYVTTLITTLSLLNKLHIDTIYKPVKCVYLNVISILVVLSFLRDVYVLFFLVEFIYIYSFRDKGWHRTIILLALLVALAFLRIFYVFSIFIFLTYSFFSKRNYGIGKKKKRIKQIIILFSLIIFYFFFNVYLYKGFGKLLMLQKADLYSIGRDTMLINPQVFYSGGYSMWQLMKFSLMQFSLGVPKFILAPVFVSYFGLFNLQKPFYLGLDSKLYLLLGVAIYNFYMLPALFSAIMTHRKGLVRYLKNNKITLYFIIMYLSALIVYSIKFFGERNMKIDFIDFYILLVIIALVTFKKKYFFMGLSFMLVLNFAVAIIKL